MPHGPAATVEALEAGAFVVHEPQWLRGGDADDLLQWLLRTLPWEQGYVTIFGRPIPEPRLTAWFSDATYTYSGRTLLPRAFPTPLAELCRRVRDTVEHPFNAVLLNRYRDGNDSMGLHSDAEPELGRNPLIASVSLGTTRRFVLEPRRKQLGRRRIYELGHGDVFVMGGTCQHCFRHGVPKQRGALGERVNLTFRYHAPSGPPAKPSPP